MNSEQEELKYPLRDWLAEHAPAFEEIGVSKVEAHYDNDDASTGYLQSYSFFSDSNVQVSKTIEKMAKKVLYANDPEEALTAFIGADWAINNHAGEVSGSIIFDFPRMSLQHKQTRGTTTYVDQPTETF